MSGEEIIKALNKHIDKKRGGVNNKLGWVVIQKDLIPNPSFKIYKTFIINLWFVKGGKKYKILSLEESIRTPEDKVDIYWDTMYNILTENLFSWIGSTSYNEVIEGSFNGIYINE